MRCQSEKANLSKRYNLYYVALTIGKVCQTVRKLMHFCLWENKRVVRSSIRKFSKERDKEEVANKL